MRKLFRKAFPTWIGLLSLGHVLTGSASISAQTPPALKPSASDGEVEFFENQIRPVLADNCFSCHGPKKQKAGLRLDSRAALLKGSENDAVIVPGKPEKSKLIQAINYGGDPQMPPKGKLPQKAIDALTAWVKIDVPWPDNPPRQQGKPSGTASTDTEDAWKSHWAFQPVKKPTFPALKDASWCRSPVDAFILSKLEEKSLTPAPMADRRTLIRRAYFDLIGLPPSAAETAAFASDPAPEAFDRLIDRLLSTPQYGERWGRYWLDVARYADSKGYVFNQERRFPYSYTYRDYVIRAFNEDVPFDQFILQQLAADRLPLGEDKHPLAAMGFLTVGRRFMNNIHDIIDDRIDVTTRGLLGLTVTCARCHDHKFDPIPSRDYYSLYGVFASAAEPQLPPVIETPRRTKEYVVFEKQLQEKERKLQQFFELKHQELEANFRRRAADYLLAGHDARGKPKTEEFMFVTEGGELNPLGVARWRKFLETSRKGSDPVFAAWHAFAALPEKEFHVQVPAVTAKIASTKTTNRLVAQAFAGAPPADLREVAKRYGDLFAASEKTWQEAHQKALDSKQPPPKSLPDPAQEELRQFLYSPGKPTCLAMRETEEFLLDRASLDQLKALRSDMEKLKATSPGAPARAMILEDSPNLYNPHVFRRGNPNNPGEAVPRQFLELLSGPQRQPFHDGSGRLELARAIASKENPLTARVLVNRVWLHHFGAGLVHTPSDFGMRSDPPTYPELLDYLAVFFMENDWSIKKLHKLILLSSTYQQISDPPPETAKSGEAADPENRLLWKMNRRRLDFEAQRDTLLAVAGWLDAKLEGAPVELTSQPFNPRRTVYGFIDRQNLPGLFRTFDFPSTDSTSPHRYETTVPQQALFLMNSPFVLEEVRRLIHRSEVESQKEPQARIQALHRLVFSREAEPEEISMGLRFIESQQFLSGGRKSPEQKPMSTKHDFSGGSRPPLSSHQMTPWEKYAQVLLMTNEFVIVD
jgi:mono/diheme cytochrome c family protein